MEKNLTQAKSIQILFDMVPYINTFFDEDVLLDVDVLDFFIYLLLDHPVVFLY